MTPEGKVKEKLKKYLDSVGAYYYMPVSNGMGAPALDFICCYKGYYFSVETKAGNKGMTDRQRMVAKRILKADGRAFLINENVDTWEILNEWIAAIG